MSFNECPQHGRNRPAAPTHDMVTDDLRFADLLASSIHDMKNVLNLQVRMLEQVARESQERGDAPAFETLSQVIFQTQHMSLNLMELLTLYKLGNASYPIEIDQHNVAEVIAEAVQHNQFMLHGKGIALTVECPADCYWYFDRELVKGVLLNGLGNAYQHTRDAIRIQCRVQGQQLELRVEDNGPGYPADMLHNEAASRGRGVNFSTGSTGLGLQFARQVAQLHRNAGVHGALCIENGGPLGGGCFVLTLP